MRRFLQRPGSLRDVREGVRSDGAVRRRAVHLSREHRAMRSELRRPLEGSQELRRMRNDVHEHDGRLQPGRMRGGVLDGSHELREFLRRYEERSYELRRMRNDVRGRRRVHRRQVWMRRG